MKEKENGQLRMKDAVDQIEGELRYLRSQGISEVVVSAPLTRRRKRQLKNLAKSLMGYGT